MKVLVYSRTEIPPWGSFEPHFEGHCILEPGHYDESEHRWVEDGRTMTLGSTFRFYDSRGVEWLAPQGSVVNGFSLPWSNPIIGTPFTGKGRRSSVIHDVACQMRRRPWRDVHQAFWEGCLTDGMSQVRAALYGGAVRLFGPRWEVANG